MMKAFRTVSRFSFGLCMAILFLAATAGAEESKPLKIAMIPKGTTHEFWKSIHAGGVKAQREYETSGGKLELIWKGPLKEDDRDQQIQVVENFVVGKVDGIVLAPLDSKALAAPVAEAAQNNIPVAIIDSSLESDKIVSFIATDNFAGGKAGGELLAKLLGGKGSVIMLRYNVGSASTEQREAGFLEAMKAFPEIKLLSTDQHSGATRETAYQAAQNLINRFGEKVNGVFTPNESSTAGMLLALREAGKNGGAIKHVGFDAGTVLIEALKAGDIQGLVVQDPFRMGYLGVKTMLDKIAGKKVEAKVDTAVKIVTPENIETAEIKDLINPPLDQYLK